VSRYFDDILRPALDGKSPPDGVIRAFYNSGLSDRTREQVSENQFMEYWTYVAGRMAQTARLFGVRYSIGEPIESEAGDQALILVTGSVNAGLLGAEFYVLPTGAIVGCVSDMHRSSSDCTRSSLAASDGEFEATYWAVKEDNAWKLVLPEGLVREMQTQTARVTVRRYRPNIVAAQDGLTIRVQEVTLQTESTTLRLLIENVTDVEAGLRNALSLTSLTDDRGVTFNTRNLRSTIPEIVPAHSSAVADLSFVADLTTFATVPVDARTLSLSLPYVRVQDRELTLHVDIALRPLPHAAMIRKSIPGEPVLVYLLTLVRPTSTTEETLKTVYQTFLSSETRGQVTEHEFVNFHRSVALDAWMCWLGVPDDFTIGVPTYSSPGQASILVTTVRRERAWLAPVRRLSDLLIFRVVKEEETWKFSLPEVLVEAIKTHPPLIRRYQLGAADEHDGLRVVVHEVVLEANKATVQLFLENDTNHDVSYDRTEATLTGRRGETFALEFPVRPSLTFHHSYYGLPGYSGETLEFAPIPLEARELRLTLRGFGNNEVRFDVPIVLDPTFACPGIPSPQRSDVSRPDLMGDHAAADVDRLAGHVP
jgi:hypothetical protein